jgi:hypothetical protein
MAVRAPILKRGRSARIYDTPSGLFQLHLLIGGERARLRDLAPHSGRAGALMSGADQHTVESSARPLRSARAVADHARADVVFSRSRIRSISSCCASAGPALGRDQRQAGVEGPINRPLSQARQQWHPRSQSTSLILAHTAG